MKRKAYMRTTHFFALTLFIITAVQSFAQPHVVDLKDRWKYFNGKDYKSFFPDEPEVRTIYLALDPSVGSASILHITSLRNFDLFINRQWTGTKRRASLDVDSLLKLHGASPVVVAIYQDDLNAKHLQTFLHRPAQPDNNQDLQAKPATFFKDFVIVGLMTLLVSIIVLVRFNPKLAGDYFSVIKIFSFHEGEELQSYTRITSSTNVLFYAYSSFLLGYYLMIIFHFVGDSYTIANSFQATSFGDAIWEWVRLSLIILGVIFLKVIVVFSFSWVFGFSNIAGIHVFNLIRVLLLFFGMVSLVIFIYYISRGQSPHFFEVLLRLLGFVVIGWMVLLFFKLMNKIDHSMFHLFSYICATELIPFLITLKVLYN